MDVRCAVPSHVGLVPDGGRRWAQENNSSYFDSYVIVMEKVVSFAEFMFSRGVDVVSIYLLSKDNLTRSTRDLIPVFEAETYLVETLLPAFAERYGVQIVLAGRLDLLPTAFAAAVQRTVQMTRAYTNHRMYLLLAYDPEDELVQAYRSWDGQTSLLSCLWVPERMDLAIRTSGEMRVSNFLPLQGGYTEYIFEEKYSNDLTQKDFANYLHTFCARTRRFGE